MNRRSRIKIRKRALRQELAMRPTNDAQKILSDARRAIESHWEETPAHYQAQRILMDAALYLHHRENDSMWLFYEIRRDRFEVD